MKRNFRPVFVVIIYLALTSLKIQSSSATPPVLETELKFSQKILTNGLTVIVVEDHRVPLVTIEIAVKNGAYTEPPEFNGLSHLYEHMFFKGNQSIPNQEQYMERQRELGMSFNGTTSIERVNYYFTLHRDNLSEGLKFMADAIRTPLFDDEELTKEKEVIFGEFDRNEADPYYHLRHEIDQKLWFKYPSYKDSLGDRETIRTATRDKLLTMQQTYYIPNNSALFITGDITPEVIFEECENLFGDWKAGPDPFIEHPPVVHPPLTQKEVFIMNQPVEIAVLYFAMPGPDTDKDISATYAADVFSYVLVQETSTFYKNMVDSGISLGASVGYFTQKNVGPISITVVTTPDKLPEAVNAIYEEIAKFDDPDYITDEQIESSKMLLEVSELYSREKTSSFTHVLSFWWCSAGIDYYTNYIKNLRKVTREDITDYIHRYIHQKPYILGVLLSKENQQRLGITQESMAQSIVQEKMVEPKSK